MTTVPLESRQEKKLRRVVLKRKAEREASQGVPAGSEFDFFRTLDTVSRAIGNIPLDPFSPTPLRLGTPIPPLVEASRKVGEAGAQVGRAAAPLFGFGEYNPITPEQGETAGRIVGESIVPTDPFQVATYFGPAEVAGAGRAVSTLARAGVKGAKAAAPAVRRGIQAPAYLLAGAAPPPDFKNVQGIRSALQRLDKSAEEYKAISGYVPDDYEEARRVLQEGVDMQLAEDLGEEGYARLLEARVELQEATDVLKALRVPGKPPPKFGTPERSDYDNARRLASEQGRKVVSVAKQRQDAAKKVRALSDEVRLLEMGKAGTAKPADVAALTRQESGAPEAGQQADIFGGVKEVRPAGKGTPTQVSMDDQMKLEAARGGQKSARFNRGSIDAAIEAALRLQSDQVQFITPSPSGFRISRNLPESTMNHVRVSPSGRVVQYTYNFPEGRYDVKELPGPRMGKPVIPEAPAAAPVSPAPPAAAPATAPPAPLAIPAPAPRPRRTGATPAAPVALPKGTPGGTPPARPPAPPTTTGAEPPRMPPDDADAAIKRLTSYIHSPESLDISTMTVQMRKAQFAQRIRAFEQRADELIAQGDSVEDAMVRAREEEMRGAFDRPASILPEAMAQDFRDALFTRIHDVLKDEGAELLATTQALQNALTGKAIPRIVGTAGGSAYTRLSRVFPPEVMKMLEEGKPLESVFEDALLKSKSPIPPHQYAAPRAGFGEPVQGAIGIETPAIEAGQEILGAKPAAIVSQPALSESERVTRQLDLMEQPREIAKQYAPPIEKVIKQPSIVPLAHQNAIVRAMKEVGLTVVDIGNLLRANIATFDFSWWRQQSPMIVNNKRDFLAANAAAAKAIKSADYAAEAEKRIKASKYYRLYADAGYDFLRPLDYKGIPAWQQEENFLVLGSKRPVGEFSEKIPWVRFGQRSFVTGTNEMNWRMFTRFVDNMYKEQEKVAAGLVKLKPGEAFDMKLHVDNFARMLGDMTGRAGLGALKEMSPALNAGLFSVRYTLGRLVTPRNLFAPSKYARKEAWKNLLSFYGTTAGIVLAGKQMGIWDVGLDPKSADFMKIRVGPHRFDPWGGYQQVAVLVSRLAAQMSTSSVTGRETPAGVVPTLARFLQSKESPLVGIITEFATGEDFIGRKTDLTDWRHWLRRIAPLSLVDMAEAIEESGGAGALVGVPSAVGVGVGSYAFKIADVREKWADDIKDYAALPTNTREARDKKVLSRADYRRKNPEIDAKLFIVGDVESLETQKAEEIAASLMRENNLSMRDIAGLEEVPYESVERRNLRTRIGKRLGASAPSSNRGRVKLNLTLKAAS